MMYLGICRTEFVVGTNMAVMCVCVCVCVCVYLLVCVHACAQVYVPVFSILVVAHRSYDVLSLFLLTDGVGLCCQKGNPHNSPLGIGSTPAAL